MKRLSNWDTYVSEALKDGDRSVELPLTEDESYILTYPSRRQGREIARAQRKGDTDALLIAMLGSEAGRRVMELSEDWPAFVLDEFLMDVMRKFGMIPDVDADEDLDEDDLDEDTDEDEDAELESVEDTEPPAKPVNIARRTGQTNGRPGKAPRKKSGTTSTR